MLTEKENIIRVKARINKLITESNKLIFILIDGDKTLTPTDSTKYFFEYLGRNFKDLEQIFHKSGYCFESFHNVALYYSDIPSEVYFDACTACSESVSIYPEFISFINSIAHKAEIIVVTSGIAKNWENILKNHSLDFVHLIGGNFFPNDNCIIDKTAKGLIVEELKCWNKTVYAFGDTMIDFEMLKKANHSYLVVNENKNDDFTEFFSDIPYLSQISFSSFSHSSLPLTTLVEIAKNILT